MLIAVVVVGSLLVYAWTMGYIDLSNENAEQEIRVQSLANHETDLVVYVQNTGNDVVQLEEASCLYVNGKLVDCEICGVTLSEGVATIGEGKTAILVFVNGAVPTGETVEIKVTTLLGRSSEYSDCPAGTEYASPVLDHFEFDVIGSSQTSYIGFSITVTALDQYGKHFAGYTGINTLDCSSGRINPTTTGEFLYGFWSGKVTVSGSASDATITTVALSNSSLTGTSNFFDVAATPVSSSSVPDHFEFDTIESPQVLGVPFSVTIRAVDQYGALVTAYDGVNVLTPHKDYIGSDISTCLGWVISPTVTGRFVDGVWMGEITLAGSATQASIATKANSFSLSCTGQSNVFSVDSLETHSVLWSRTYDKTGNDYACDLTKTSDGGYAIVGGSSLIKVDEAGNIEWSKTYDGAFNSLVEVSTGGYALAGFLSIREERGSVFGFPSYYDQNDFYLLKTDSSGNVEWKQTYGRPEDDMAFSLVEASDGGYVLAGKTKEYYYSPSDFWLVKTDSSGNMEWNRVYDGRRDEIAQSVIATSDGGYAFTGIFDTVSNGTRYFLVIKTDASGNIGWNQTYGNLEISMSNIAHSLIETSDGGYAIVGEKYCYSGSWDLWLVKTDSSGNMLWNQTYGGIGCENVDSLVQTSDGGYAIVGETTSFDDNGDYDFWFVKTDEAGNMLWSQAYNGTDVEIAYSFVETSEGEYVLAGTTGSYSGSWDLWLVKTK